MNVSKSNKSHGSETNSEQHRFMQETLITQKSSKSAPHEKDIPGPLDKFSMMQKGTSLQILDVASSSDLEKIENVMNENNIKPERVIPIQQSYEVWLQFLTFEECNETLKILR